MSSKCCILCDPLLQSFTASQPSYEYPPTHASEIMIETEASYYFFFTHLSTSSVSKCAAASENSLRSFCCLGWPVLHCCCLSCLQPFICASGRTFRCCQLRAVRLRHHHNHCTIIRHHYWRRQRSPRACQTPCYTTRHNPASARAKVCYFSVPWSSTSYVPACTTTSARFLFLPFLISKKGKRIMSLKNRKNVRSISCREQHTVSTPALYFHFLPTLLRGLSYLASTTTITTAVSSSFSSTRPSTSYVSKCATTAAKSRFHSCRTGGLQGRLTIRVMYIVALRTHPSAITHLFPSPSPFISPCLSTPPLPSPSSTTAATTSVAVPFISISLSKLVLHVSPHS